MKLAIFLLAVAAVNAAHPRTAFRTRTQANPSINWNTDQVNGQAYNGYPNRFSLPKASSSAVNAYGAFPWPSTLTPTAFGTGSACFQMLAMTNNVVSNQGKVDFFVTAYTGSPASAYVPTGSGPSDFPLTTCSFAGDSSSTKPVSVSCTLDTTNYCGNGTCPNGLMVGAKGNGCTGCASTADYSITALFGWVPPGTGGCGGNNVYWLPVMGVDNIYTWNFGAYPGGGSLPAYQYQPMGVIIPTSAPQPIYALVGANLNVVYTMTTPSQTAPQPSNPPAFTGPNDGSTGYYVIPLGTPKSTPTQVGGVTLAAGQWYAVPFLSSGTNWQFALGFGHQPSAASGLAPSILLAAVFAALAALL